MRGMTLNGLTARGIGMQKNRKTLKRSQAMAPPIPGWLCP